MCTRRCVFKFQLMPNCLPQYWQRYSLAEAVFPDVSLVVPSAASVASGSDPSSRSLSRSRGALGAGSGLGLGLRRGLRWGLGRGLRWGLGRLGRGLRRPSRSPRLRLPLRSVSLSDRSSSETT